MKIIVCGAGQVGSTIARHLSNEGNDVTVLDTDPEQARRVDESYEVRGMVGHASHPEVLQRAGADDADMLIAVTRSDEVNMVACQVAYSLFRVPRRIARVRHHGYLEPVSRGLYANDQLPVDVIISPEIEVANGIARRLRTPGAFDTLALAGGCVRLIGLHCDSGTCSVVGRRIEEIPAIAPGQNFKVLALIRAGRAFMPSPGDRIERGDDAFVVAPHDRVDDVMALFGHRERMARRIVIVGGGNVGLSLAQVLIRDAPQVHIKLIEHNRERANFVSRTLGDDAVVLHGDALDKEVLEEANIASAETVVAVTNDDETNIFTSVLAKRAGCVRAVTLVNKASYEPLLPSFGIDAVVSPSAITISTILRQVRHRAVAALHTLREDFGEVIEFQAQVGSPLVEDALGRVGLPKGMMIGAVVRPDKSVIVPDLETRIAPGDSVVALVTYDALSASKDILAGRDGA